MLKYYLIFIFTIPVYAFSQFEEYSHFSESEIKDINSPLLIDSEYFSDMLTYRLPLTLDNQFLRSPRAYDLTIGSLSRARFATQQRLKLDTQLSDVLTFRLAYFEKKDLEQNINHLILELQYHWNSTLSLVAYTELLSDKKLNDFGVATLLNFSDNHQLRIYATAIDSSFNQRTEEQELDNKSAYAYGFVGRLLSEQQESFLEYYGRIQTSLQRRFLDDQEEYTFRESKVGLRGRQSFLGDSSYLNFDLSYKYRTEGLLPLGVGARDLGLWRGPQWDLLLQYETQSWIYGVASFIRRWEVANQDVKSQTYLPHFWYKFVNESDNKEIFRLGYEASFHDTNGPEALKTPPDRNRSIEHRANLRYSISFSESATLHLQFTADLDELSWEGGNGTFQILF